MRIEKKATLISSSVAALLVVIKMTIGVLSGSIAVLASAIDSFLDLAISLFNYFALSHAEKEPDRQFNFGRNKLEPLAAVIEGSIISISGLFILYEAINKIYHEEPTTYLGASIMVMIVSIVITGLLVLFLRWVANKTGNMVIKTDALHYQTDLFSNGAVLLALVIIHFTGEQLIDPILGIGIAAYMIYAAFPIVKEGVMMLLDAALPEDDVAKIKKVLDDESGINGYHYLRTRQSGSVIFISVHVVFNVSTSLYDAHMVADRIELKFKKLFPGKSVESIVHMDPYDDQEINEMEHAH